MSQANESFAVALVNQPSTAPFLLPAPVGGWNQLRSEVAMPKEEALLLENWLPEANKTSIRQGCSTWGMGTASPIRSMFVYNGLPKKLLAFSNQGVHNATSAGDIGAVMQALTKGEVSFCNFANEAGRFGIVVNGSDSLIRYDGTSWTVLPSFTYSSGALTLDTNRLSFVLPHKARLWFLEEGTLNAWYLPAAAISGEIQKFPLGSFFSQGGQLHSAFTWTIDGGSGPDDYLCFMSTEGEVVVYQGTDPALSSTWSLVGSYSVGKPVGVFPPIKYGGDVLILTTIGLLPFSKVLKGEANLWDSALTQKVDVSYSSLVEQYLDTSGWFVQIVPHKKLLIINAPVEAETRFIQFVVNLNTGSWASFSGWNAFCWQVFDQKVYFGTNSGVKLAFSGKSDSGEAITATLKHAFLPMLEKYGNQLPVLFRPHLRVTENVTVRFRFASNYDPEGEASYVDFTLEGDRYNEANWNEMIWADASKNIQSWTEAPASPGYAHSLEMQIITDNASVTYTATDVLVQNAQSLL